MKTSQKLSVTTRKKMRCFAIINFRSLKFYLVTAMVTLALASGAQSFSGSRVSSLPDSVIEARLVELALKSPEVEKTIHQNNIYGLELKSAKSSWMNFLSFSINYNDQSFAKNNPSAYVYPKYYFGLTIPLGTIISGHQTKIAKESVAIGALTQEEVKRQLKADVIGKYKQYKAQAAVIGIEIGYMNDLEAALKGAEEKFRNNSIPFEAYNLASKNRNDQQARIINLRLDQDLTKLEIERLIGTNLENVLK
jgi:outer membrane protein TolC